MIIKTIGHSVDECKHKEKAYKTLKHGLNKKVKTYTYIDEDYHIS